MISIGLVGQGNTIWFITQAPQVNKLHLYEKCVYPVARVNPRRTNTKDEASRERRLKPATTLHYSTIDDISLKAIEVCSILHSCGKKTSTAN